MAELTKLPWDERRCVNIGSNEFVNQFTLNRNLNKLLENDLSIFDQLEHGNLTKLAIDGDAVAGVDDTRAITSRHLHFVDTQYVPLVGDNLIKSDAGSYTYLINEFEGDGSYDLQPQQIRSLIIESFLFGGDSHNITITLQIFNNDNVMNLETVICRSYGDNGDDDCGSGNTVNIPINHDTKYVTLIIHNYHGSIMTFNIKACTQRIFSQISAP